MSLIYKITNKINGKIYIGKTEREFNVRIEEHIKSKRKRGIDGAIKKYGIELFLCEIIEKCDINKLNEKEKYYIKKFNSYKNGYNLTLGGEGISGWVHDDATKNKISKRSKELWKDKNYRKKIHNEKSHKKISKTLTGTKFSEERKINHSYAMKKSHASNEYKEKCRIITKNKYKNPIERIKQSKRLSKEWILTNPEGKIYKIKNLYDFCKNNFGNYKGFLDGFYRVSKGKQKNYKNWICEKL